VLRVQVGNHRDVIGQLSYTNVYNPRLAAPQVYLQCEATPELSTAKGRSARTEVVPCLAVRTLKDAMGCTHFAHLLPSTVKTFGLPHLQPEL
jgi:hypothetical protein